MLTQAEVEYKQNCSNFVHAKKLCTEPDFSGEFCLTVSCKISISIYATGMIPYILLVLLIQR